MPEALLARQLMGQTAKAVKSIYLVKSVFKASSREHTDLGLPTSVLNVSIDWQLGGTWVQQRVHGRAGQVPGQVPGMSYTRPCTYPAMYIPVQI